MTKINIKIDFSKVTFFVKRSWKAKINKKLKKLVTQHNDRHD